MTLYSLANLILLVLFIIGVVHLMTKAKSDKAEDDLKHHVHKLFTTEGRLSICVNEQAIA